MMLRMMQVVMKNQNKAKKSSSKPKSNIAIKELNVASKNLMDPIPEDIMVNVVEMEIKTVGNVDPPSKPPTELDEGSKNELLIFICFLRAQCYVIRKVFGSKKFYFIPRF
ncbi:hypothetical protein D0Y65_018036 [Glycine soja]|uniref:Uncharacterized protein n=1 Tax=Glycine soja TaxID=3848 RepID=A0A445JXI4_GLYSO|nr:hypothetical protein D0Y65_018036 [Glycine soja]RZC03204.1 hypothetical protein D0Y65_018036 [Glycine soja]